MCSKYHFIINSTARYEWSLKRWSVVEIADKPASTYIYQLLYIIPNNIVSDLVREVIRHDRR